MPITILNRNKIVPLLPGLIINPLQKLENIVKTHGDIILFRLTDEEQIILVNDADFVHHILAANEKNYIRTQAIPKFGKYLGEGLLNAPQEKWEVQRRILKDSFSEPAISGYRLIIEKLTNDYAEELIADRSGETIALGQTMKNFFLKIMCGILFVEGEKFPVKSILETGEKVNETASMLEQKLIQFYSMFYSGYKEKKYARLDKLIEQQRENAESVIQIGERNLEKAQPFLAQLLASERDNLFSRESIRDQIINMFFAGFDTISSAITWFLHVLSTDHELENLILSDVVNSKNDELLESAINETLRLYPPAWSFPRFAVDEDAFGGVHIPKGMHLLISPYLMHRSAKYWESPLDFRPDRFVNFKPSPSTSFIPFGFGRHTCIGKRLALFELKIVIPILLKKIKFLKTTNKEPKIWPGIIIKPKPDIRVKVLPRK